MHIMLCSPRGRGPLLTAVCVLPSEAPPGLGEGHRSGNFPARLCDSESEQYWGGVGGGGGEGRSWGPGSSVFVWKPESCFPSPVPPGQVRRAREAGVGPARAQPRRSGLSLSTGPLLSAPQVIRKIRVEQFPDASGSLKLWCQFFNILSDSVLTWAKDQRPVGEVGRR